MQIAALDNRVAVPPATYQHCLESASLRSSEMPAGRGSHSIAGSQ